MSALHTLLVHSTCPAHLFLLSEEPPAAVEVGHIFESKVDRDNFSAALDLAYNQLLAVPIDDESNPAYRIRPVAVMDAGLLHVSWYMRQQEGGPLLEHADNALLHEKRWHFQRCFHRFYCAMHNMPMGPLLYEGINDEFQEGEDQEEEDGGGGRGGAGEGEAQMQ